ncbi:hypothetical protein H0X10_00610 [Candidatus Saccharibacteria bacterium]|nr:hypothetical protein [Candidatus Saccharibacteria bacterium]
MRERVLKTSFQRYDGSFASGKMANNKLELELIPKRNKALGYVIVTSIGNIAMSYKPQFVVAVPDGANWIAKGIAKQQEIPLIKLKKDPETKAISFRYKTDQRRCSKAERGVLVEDAFNEFTNTRRVLEIPELDERIVAVLGIWDRGIHESAGGDRQELSLPTRALLTEHIPAVLPEDSELWKFAK